ncbi:MAG TPA: glycosyltransferase [Pyrinomonadaceae bacterium]|nr:glycosyltransferase [Pyrinomonadaceae bacterium]
MLSVIVPIYKNTNLVEYCLQQLVDRLPSDAELIIVDDASGTETLQLLERFEVARLIKHQHNQGNTVAYNAGAAAARGDFLVFVDSDVFVPVGALEDFSQVLSADDSLGAVGSLLLYPYDYTIQHAGVAFDSWSTPHLFVGRRPDEIDLQPMEERQAVTAAFFATRRTVFEEVGGFEETYRDGMEDIEYCLRCRELGYRNVLLSSFPAFHLESATRGPYIHIRQVYNRSIFYSRWTGRFKPDLLDYVSASAEKAIGNGNAIVSPAPVLNFCTTPNWIELAETLRHAGVDLGSTHNLSGWVSESESIDLFRTVPLAFNRLPSSIVFVVDYFKQLTGNRLWFSRRPSNDVVVDRHANVLTGRPFGFSEQP